MEQHKQLIVKLDINNASEQIVDNFILNLSKILSELYPEIKISEKGWEIQTLDK